jgi:SAM-dependent methyltransferase
MKNELQSEQMATHEIDKVDWPADGIESLGHCPVCGSKARQVLHTMLTDDIYKVAPGSWSLQQCGGCKSAYLDPRPTRETIGLAYAEYHTHEQPSRFMRAAPTPKNALRRLTRSLTNGYVNARYGTAYQPATWFGYWLMKMLPVNRRRLDRPFSELKFRVPIRCPEGGKLLDVGCGSGIFLQVAREAGWQTFGVDFDHKAVSCAHALDLNVLLGGIEQFSDKENFFDVITIGHVIEHVHDPKEVLMEVHRLLKPGGILWIETPNISSVGHSYWGRYWRGLEPPRHLVLFNYGSLRNLLGQVGFQRMTTKVRHGIYAPLAAQSDAIQNGGDVRKYVVLRKHRVGAAFSRIKTFFWPRTSEYISITCRKANNSKTEK